MEVINSFFSNIKDKLTNPFFGTLILVLIFHHWEVIFAIFNFESDCTLNEKLFFLKEYATKNITFQTLLQDIGYAVIYMALGFLIVISTRSIVMLMEHNLMPLITKKIVNKNVVEKIVYDEVVKEREEYFDQYEEQRKNVRTFSKTIDSQNLQIREKDIELVKQSKSISETLKKNNELEQIISTLTNTKNNLETYIKTTEESLLKSKEQNKELNEQVVFYESLFYDDKNSNHYINSEKFPPIIINKVDSMKTNGNWKNFIDYSNYKRKGGAISNNTINAMVEEGLIKVRDNFDEWTTLGNMLNRYRMIFK